MTTPERPESPPLTRRQMRDLRTGSTPVIETDAAPEDSRSADAPVAEAPAPAPIPLPRAAEPLALPAPPGPDLAVDLGVSPLTRRQARQQERIRTASVPVITPEVAAAHAASLAETATAADAATQPESATAVEAADAAEEPDTPWPFAELGLEPDGADDADAAREEPGADVADPEVAESEVAKPAAADVEPEAETPAAEIDEPESEEDFAAIVVDEPSTEVASLDSASPSTDAQERPILNPAFGAALLSGTGEQTSIDSFDDLITRSSTGSAATPNALILTQSPGSGPIVAPLSGTGEVLITGTLNLPEGLGSTGHAPGMNDGKEVDAVLVDGELPAHSSPTPIAASSAISTVKTPGEIIKPPSPEKGGRLMMTLAITAGVLALALVGVLILAFATGVFS